MNTDTLIRYSHRGLWIALSFILLGCAYAIGLNLWPDSAFIVSANHAAPMFPIVVVVLAVASRRGLPPGAANPDSAQMRALLGDELRQASINRGLRNAFGAVLLLQPVCALALTTWQVHNPVTLMAALTVLVGTATLIASVLAYDR
jgi:hypothetical protein